MPPTVATARYQNAGGIKASGLSPVRITLGAPRFNTGYSFAAIRELAPSKATFAIRDDAQFDAAYVAQLDRLDPDRLAASFGDLAGDNPGVVLLCFEDLRVMGPNSCHRRTFARWWQAKTGDPVPELEETDPPRVKAKVPKDTGLRRLF